MDPAMTDTTGDATDADATAESAAAGDATAGQDTERDATAESAAAGDATAGQDAAVGLDAAAGAAGRARAFVHAIVWAEHTTLWDLLSAHGQAAALSVAVRNGLDRVVASRIRDGLADPVERDRFLQQLVGGLRRDLRSVELTELTVGVCGHGSDGTVTVEMQSPSRLPGTDAWPAGRLILSRDPDRGWLVDRLEPRLAGP